MSAPTHERHPLYVWAWSLVHLDFVGVAFGTLFFCLSLTPSLLPRDWLFQGLISGLNAAIGYGIGVFARQILRRFVFTPPHLVATAEAGEILGKGAHGGGLDCGQRRNADFCRSLAASGVGGGGLGRPVDARLPSHADHRRPGRRGVRGWGTGGSGPHQDHGQVLDPALALHHQTALFIGTAIVVVLAIMLINGVLIRGFLAGANRVFQPQNTTTRPGSPSRLSPRSGVQHLSRHGDPGLRRPDFVANGPDADELQSVNGRPAKEPIRVYVGLQTAEDDSRGRPSY